MVSDRRVVRAKPATVEQLSESLGGLQGKRVLVRSDLNVPLDGSTITDEGRIKASVPTISDLRSRGAKVIVMAHLGRPTGEPDPAYSLAPVAARLGELLGAEVVAAEDTVGESAQAAVAAMADGDVVVLENVRFNAGETSKDEAERGAFADQLAALGDAFVSDGFGVVHRKQASVYDVAQRLPHAAGGLVLAEVEVLKRLTESPERPYAVVLGGSKVSDKLGVIDNLLTKADKLLIGGGMVFTFLKAQGHEVGKSLLEADQLDTVRGYLDQAAKAGVEIMLADRHRGGTGVRCRCTGDGGRGRRDPCRPAWSRHRTGVRAPPSLRRWPMPRRCSGTARWGSSRWLPSPKAPARWPRHSPRSTVCRSWVAATRPRPCASSASPTTSSATSRPAGERASNTSRARPLPGIDVLKD